MKFNFISINTRILKSRIGEIITPRGVIQTPSFIPCATRGFIKRLGFTELETLGCKIILSNIYHIIDNKLYKLIVKSGGIHNFVNWGAPIITDSGGFQILSMRNKSVLKFKQCLKNIESAGAHFYENFILTPEKSISLQKNIGSDILFPLDECIPHYLNYRYTKISMQISHNWIYRSYLKFLCTCNNDKVIYGIIQGGIHRELRLESCDFINSKNFFGYGVGGSIGGNEKQMHSIVSLITNNIHSNKPIHLLGIGKIFNVIKVSLIGIDTFDCTHPTRIARHSCALLRNEDIEYINLTDYIYKNDYRPIDGKCNCYSCIFFSRSYIRYMIKYNELLPQKLISLHNINFMIMLLNAIKKKVFNFLY